MSNDRNSRPPPSLGQVRPDRYGQGSVAGPGHGYPGNQGYGHGYGHGPGPGPMPPPPRPPRGYPAGPSGPRARPGARPAPRRRRSSLGRALLYGLSALLLMVAVGVGLLIVFPPTDVVRTALANEVARQTGRKLTIGSAGISLFSGLGVTMSDVALSAPPGMEGAPLLKAERLDVSIALLPFILREIKVDHLSLVRPRIELRVDASGRRSWDFASATVPARPLRYAQAQGPVTDAAKLPEALRDFARGGTPPQATDTKGSGIGIEGLSLADVRIEKGVLRYRDQRSGLDRELGDIDARLAMPQTGGPVEVKGNFTFSGERFALDGRLDTMRELLAERPVSVRLSLDGAPLALTYDGKVGLGGEPSANGKLGFKTTAPDRAAALLAIPLAGAGELGRLDIDSQVRASPRTISLSPARIALGDATATGSIEVDLAAARPAIDTNLRIAGLDIDKLRGIGAAGVPPATPGRYAAPLGSAPPPADQPPGGPGSIEDLLKRSVTPSGAGPDAGPRVRGFRQRSGNQWDIEPIDAAVLKRFDLNGRFHISDMRVGGLEARAVQAAAELKGGHLRANVTEGQLAGGSVRALVSVDARQPALALGLNVSGDGVAVAPLFRFAGLELLEGRGRTVATLSARGTSEREIVSTLAGRAEVRITEGALIGWNADGLLASLMRGEVPSTKRMPDARTPFRQLSGSFQIASGVARTSDLALDSNTLQASGTGLVNIVDRNIDLTLKPKLSGNGLQVPVRVAGPWDEPSVVPDVAGVLNTPQAQEAARHLRDGNVDGALRSVLGDGPKADEKINKAKDFLNRFLKQ